MAILLAILAGVCVVNAAIQYLDENYHMMTILLILAVAFYYCSMGV